MSAIAIIADDEHRLHPTKSSGRREIVLSKTAVVDGERNTNRRHQRTTTSLPDSLDDVISTKHHYKQRKSTADRGKTSSGQQQQQQLLPEVGIGGVGSVQTGSGLVPTDDEDDRASVCSSQSSASEHSTTSRSSTGTTASSGRRRPRCPLHGSSSRSGTSRRTAVAADANGGGDVPASTSSSPSKPGETSGTCTCRSDRRRARKAKSTTAAAADLLDEEETYSTDVTVACCNVERPEPEGGLQLPTGGGTFKNSSTMADEFERLIYGPSEPLFSDSETPEDRLDDDVDDKSAAAAAAASSSSRTSTSERLRPSGPRMIYAGGVWAPQSAVRKAAATVAADTAGGVGGCGVAVDATESLFSAAQMVNSNNMMKFAIIQTELKNVKDVSLRRAENDVTALWRRSDAVNDGCTQADCVLESVTERLAELLAVLRASSRKRDDRQQAAAAKRSEYIRQGAAAAAAGARRCRATTSDYSAPRRLIVNDVDVYKAHESLDAAERQVGELEEELKAAVSSMSNCSPGQHPEKKIRDITLRLKEAEHRATVAERSVFQLRREAARHNDEIKADKKKHQPISARLSSCTFTELTGC